MVQPLSGSRVVSWRPCSNPGGLVSGGFTIALLLSLEGDFDFVRFIYENDSTSTAMNIDAVVAAPSALLSNYYDPRYGDGTAVAWSPVYFNNAGAAGDLPAPAGSTVAIAAIAAAADATNPTRAYTDWTPLSSLARADPDAAQRLLMIRTLTGAANVFRTMRQANILTAWRDPQLSLGRVLREAHKTGDFVTTNQAGFAGSSPVEGDYVAPVSVQYLARAAGGTVMGVGDSLTASNGVAAANMGGFGFLACAALSGPLRPVQWHCEAYPGQTSAAYYARGLAAVPVIKPAVTILQTMSGNEANNTSSIVEAAYNRAVTLAEMTRRNGGVPIWVTPYPRSYGATAEAFRQMICARLRGKAANNSELVLDADQILRDPMNPAAIRSEFYVDGTHINYVGEGAMAALASPLIARALAAA